MSKLAVSAVQGVSKAVYQIGIIVLILCYLYKLFIDQTFSSTYVLTLLIIVVVAYILSVVLKRSLR